MFILFVAGCGRDEPEAPAPGVTAGDEALAEPPEPHPLLALAGPGTTSAFRVRMDEVRRSPYYDGIRASLVRGTDPVERQESEWLVSFLDRTDALVAVTQHLEDGESRNVLLLRGDYRDADMQQLVEGEAGLLPERANGVTTYVRENQALMKLGDHTLAMGEATMVRGVLERSLEPAPEADPEEGAVAALREHPWLEAHDVAGVLLVTPAMAQRLAQRHPAWAERLDDVESMAFGLTLRDGLLMRIEGEAVDPMTAADLAAMVQGQIAQLSESPLADALHLDPVIEAVRIETQDALVMVHLALDDPTLRALLEGLRGLQAPPPSAPPSTTPTMSVTP